MAAINEHFARWRQDYVRFLIFIGYFLVLNLVGTVGFMAIEGWSWNDALYMTAITLTAVGYHEVHPLTQTGRYWTMGLLAGGLTGLGVWFALVTAAVVRIDIGNTYRRRKTMRRLAQMKGHVIVCGGGQMGRQLLHELDDSEKPFVLVEHDRETVESLRRVWPDALIVHDDATRDRVLREAGIERASGLASCLSADTDNLFVCLSARQLNEELVVVGRAEDESTTRKMYRAGANNVVSPNVSGASWMATVLVRPSLAPLLEVTSPGPSRLRQLEQATVGPKSRIAGMTLAEAAIPEETGLVVIALRKEGMQPGEITFNPGAEERLSPGDDLIVLGDGDQIRALRGYIG